MSTSFSVLLSVYHGDDPAQLDAALASCFRQTREPDELLVVEDGPLTEALEAVLDRWATERPKQIRRHALPENRGLGEALRIGVRECRHQLIARFDADDVNVETRFEIQCDFMASHPEIDVLGGYIGEFTDDPETLNRRREVPTAHDAIRRRARFRNPINHVTVMFRREAVLSVGNYRPVMPLEDYDLWVRLLCDGATFRNLPEVLVKVRAGEEMIARRGGLAYARADARRQWDFYRRGFVSLPVMLVNLVTRVPLRLVPPSIRHFIYTAVARDPADATR
ncbi:glycosyltransferase [Haloarcula salina]|uniref:glycosyltransferase n=1 Tax=Haloarcula salina TaxID=1429914 RepID=UPI003C705B8E